jgi:phosphoribosylanthranilate isomerase
MGKRLNLEWFQNRDNSKIILAGGLTPDNLHELKWLNFFGVDVSSGVEEKLRIKSHKKIEQFIKLAKNL